MNIAQSPFLVEGILILVSMLFGLLLKRAGKPYGKMKLGIHLFFFLWFAIGFAFILYGTITMGGTKGTGIPVGITGLMLLIQLVSGIRMMASKESAKALPAIHMISTILMLVCDVWAFIITGRPS